MFVPRGAVEGRVEEEEEEKKAVKWKNESLQAARQKAETDLNMTRDKQIVWEKLVRIPAASQPLPPQWAKQKRNQDATVISVHSGLFIHPVQVSIVEMH